MNHFDVEIRTPRVPPKDGARSVDPETLFKLKSWPISAPSAPEAAAVARRRLEALNIAGVVLSTCPRQPPNLPETA